MSKGTPSHGKRGKRKTHITCPRCGKWSYNKRKKRCAACRFGVSSRIKRKLNAKSKKIKANRFVRP